MKHAIKLPLSTSQDDPHNTNNPPTTNKEQRSNAGNHKGDITPTRGPHSTTAYPKAHGQHESTSATDTAAIILCTGRQLTKQQNQARERNKLSAINKAQLKTDRKNNLRKKKNPPSIINALRKKIL